MALGRSVLITMMLPGVEGEVVTLHRQSMTLCKRWTDHHVTGRTLTKKPVASNESPDQQKAARLAANSVPGAAVISFQSPVSAFA